jgi:hypothetical protein
MTGLASLERRWARHRRSRFGLSIACLAEPTHVYKALTPPL